MPVGIIYAVVILCLFAVWAAGDTALIVQQSMAAVLIAVWQTLILVGFPRLAGRIAFGEQPTEQQPAQFTVRQGFYFTGSIAVLLAIVQFLKWDGISLPGIVSSVIFLVGYGAVLTIPATFAMWAAFRIDNPIKSLLLSILSVVPLSLAYHLAEGNPSKSLGDVVFFYGPAVMVTFIVWLGIRYCRAHGYRIAKS